MRRVCIALAVAMFAAALPVATAVAAVDEPSLPPVEGAAADETGKSTPGAGDPAAEDIEPAPERPRSEESASPEVARSAAAVVQDVTPVELAAAMGVPEGNIVDASVLGSDPRAFAVFTLDDFRNRPSTPEPDPGPVPTLMTTAEGEGPALPPFPTQGSTFLVMSTGNAADAPTPNTSGGLTTVLDGLKNTAGNDLTRLHLALDPPAGAACLAFDVAFYSDEYPEYVGSVYNDVFTAQIGDARLLIDGSTVEAPGNFAVDSFGNQLSINTVFGMVPDWTTTYDGATSVFRASTPLGMLAEGDVIDLYLSIQDLGDSAFDSAVFLDGFFWSSDPMCAFGLGADLDSDGDGLLDTWEINGYRPPGAGPEEFVDLPAMGADPNVPDVFVEIDFMQAGSTGFAPDPAAIAAVVDRYREKGIHLHVDYGRGAPLTYGEAATWGDLSRGGEVRYLAALGTGVRHDDDTATYGWGDFDEYVAEEFDSERRPVFHYNLWADKLGGDLSTTPGLSRGGEANFIIAKGAWSPHRATEERQAKTFMHELGHNLGLGHGGGDRLNYKPNYLSIMNYLFTAGVPRDLPLKDNLALDYSSYRLPTLDERDLDESVGIGTAAWTRLYNCEYMIQGSPWWQRGSQLDWNCNQVFEERGVTADINEDGRLTTLEGYDDWANLQFMYGSIGRPAMVVELPEVEVIEEYTVDVYLQAEGLTATPTLFATSDTHLTNNFHASGEQADVVVDGNVTCTAQTRVNGDLIASGDVRLTNTCTVGGDVLAGGSVTLSARPVVHGSVMAVGDVRMQSTATVLGDVRAGGTFTSTDGRTVEQLVSTGSVGGEVAEGAEVTAPVLPAPAASAELTSAGYDELTWTEWLNTVAAANSAPVWSRGLTASPGCVMGPWASSVNGDTVTVTAPTRVDARRPTSGCAQTSLQGMTLRLGADLVLVADSWRVTNGLRVESVDGAVHTLHVVVPGAPGAGPGDLTVTNGIKADDVSVVRMVAPGSVRVNGPAEFGGSIVGGSVSVTGRVELRWPVG